ncbi:hypothetical protein PBAL39_15619 [Pedobacter sp. BAL39]|uniref:ClbS/DfsB family four-helix bundle protein n=1 Tax=Pedobacter sp. BAL39 TaxID=391596 RepID=UPI0001559ED9|nr:ClbS/DfsB family four-helix bundle protein [Pedobacter sp. BAL39]EDM37867.1 hypothetical protein PBAL39_15619 [Pedobacter sp. BAL39]
MGIPGTKEALLAEINRTYFLLKSELSLITPNQSLRLDLEGHGKGTVMSVHNLVSYLVGWGELVLRWWDLRSQDMPCDFPETGYKWNELGRLAQKFYKDYQVLDYDVLLLKLDDTVAKLLHLVEALDDHELYGRPFLDKWTIGRLIQFNSSSPYKNARIRLRKWKRGASNE